MLLRMVKICLLLLCASLAASSPVDVQPAKLLGVESVRSSIIDTQDDLDTAASAWGGHHGGGWGHRGWGGHGHGHGWGHGGYGGHGWGHHHGGWGGHHGGWGGHHGGYWG